MNIHTKFDILDTVYFLMLNKVFTAIIKSIDIKIDSSSHVSYIRYWIDKNPAGDSYTKCFNENEVFKTKEELLKSL